MLLEKNKVAIVTGAMSFLGKEIVKKLSEKFLVLKTGTNPIDDVNYFQADLTSVNDAKKMIDWALQKTKRIDCLICCVGGNNHKGIHPKTDDAYNVEASDVVILFNRNVVTAINSCRFAVPHMIDKKFGRICFIGTNIVGNPQPNGFLTSYTIAKAALHEYTLHLANQLKDTGINVNCISPCGIAGSSPNGKNTDVTSTKVSQWVDNYCSPASGETGQVIRILK